jgi:hypothetical protein
MSERWRIELEIACNERRLTQPAQQYDDRLILEPFSTDIKSDLSNADAPSLQENSLSVEDILIEDDHERIGCSA